MQGERKKLGVLLAFLNAGKIATIAKAVADFVKKHEATHVFVNYEYGARRDGSGRPFYRTHKQRQWLLCLAAP